MTVYEIAELAGVSPGTVSKVVNGRPGISEETRSKVLRILYKNDLSLPGKPEESSSLVGILVSDISNLYFSKGAWLVQEVLTSNGYCPVILDTGQSLESKLAAMRMLAQQNVRGVVMAGSTFGIAEVLEAVPLCLPDIPVVMVNGFSSLSQVSWVRADIREGVKAAVSYLYKTGRRSFAYLSTFDTPMSREKIEGFNEALAQNGLGGQLLRAPDDTFKSGFDAVLRADQPFDALIASTDLVAAGAMAALSAQGRAVPGDAAVFGMDNTEYAKLTSPRLSTIDGSLDAMSEEAAWMLLSMIRCPGKRMEKLFPCPLIVRESAK